MSVKKLGIYFDYFGTLIDEHHVLTNAWSAIAEGLGLEISPNDPRIWEGIQKQNKEASRLNNLSLEKFEENRKQLNSIVLNNLGIESEGSLSAVIEVFDQVFSTGSTFRLYPHCKETLEQIHSLDLTVGLLSNAHMDLCAISMKRLGIFEFFDHFVLSKDVGFDKSHVEFYEIALARMQKDNVEKIIHVGDSVELDVNMAQQVGMIPILFDPHELHPNEEVITIKEFPELLQYLII